MAVAFKAKSKVIGCLRFHVNKQESNDFDNLALFSEFDSRLVLEAIRV